MAASPQWKVYSNHGEYVAACKYPEDAGAIVALHGPGWQIRAGHTRVVWLEGNESQDAGASFDLVAHTCYRRTGDIAARMNARLKQ